MVKAANASGTSLRVVVEDNLRKIDTATDAELRVILKETLLVLHNHVSDDKIGDDVMAPPQGEPEVDQQPEETEGGGDSAESEDDVARDSANKLPPDVEE